MTTRRTWMGSAVALLAVLGWPRASRASQTLAVAVPHPALGAIVAAVGGSAVSLHIDGRLAAKQIKIDGAIHDVSHRILLKGAGPARRRFLDDARNATKVSANLRDALAKAAPELASQFEDRHKAWSRPFAKKVLAWQTRLAKSKLRNKRMRDPYGRVYLLEWAGAHVDDQAKAASPPALAKLPSEPSAANLAEYERYIERLVAALT